MGKGKKGGGSSTPKRAITPTPVKDSTTTTTSTTTTPPPPLSGGDDSSPYLRTLSHHQEQNDGKYVLILVSRTTFVKQVLRNQDFAISILELNQVPYQVLDGSDPKYKAQRDRLFQISGIGGTNYPQFFKIVDGKDIFLDAKDWDASTTFWGDYAKFETYHENNRIAKEFWGVAPPPTVNLAATTPAKPTTTTTTTTATLDAAMVKQQQRLRKEQRRRQGCCNMDCFMGCIILIVYSLVVISIPLYIKIRVLDEHKPHRGEDIVKFLKTNLKHLPNDWEQTLIQVLRLDEDYATTTTTTTTKTMETDEDGTAAKSRDQCTTKHDDTGSCTSPSLGDFWTNPLPDKDFFANIFGISKEPVKKQPKGGDALWNDPFDWVANGRPEQDPERQNIFDNIANLFKSNQSGMEPLITKLLARKADPSTVMERQSFVNMLSLLTNAAAEVLRQVNETLGHVGLDRFNLLQLLYYMDYEESIKNSVWRRRAHRYQTPVPTEAAMQLYDGLYLSQLAYAPSCQEIYNRIQTFRGGLWTLRNCTVKASVQQPAHYVLVRKLGPGGKRQRTNGGVLRESPKRRQQKNPLLNVWDAITEGNRQQLEVALVIRGSKDVFDFLTDGHLLATDYQGGKAHEGILGSAKWLEQMYQADFKQFWENSRKQSGMVSRKPMRLWLIGHSLGGGAAAVAAMQFRDTNYTDWLDAEALGFGTPSIVSPEISYKYHEYITTVVNDADVVPRTSGLVMAKAWLKVVAFNWTNSALDDFDQLVTVFQSDKNIQKYFGRKGHEFVEQACRNIRRWLETWFDENVAPWLQNLPGPNLVIDQKHAELIPPGECIHFYRDGVAYQANYVNCSFFDEIELVRHFVDDHLIPPGYYMAILSFVRSKLKNVSWVFENDILDIDYK